MSDYHSSYEYDFDPADPNNTASAVYRMARAGGGRILDLGSGPGIVSSRLKREDGRSVVCLDRDAERLAAARQRGLDRTILADLNGGSWANELAGERFDVVILADVLEHLVAPGAALDVIRRRLLSDDGFLVVSIPNAFHEGIIGELIAGRFSYRETGLLDSTHLRFFNREAFERLAEAHGFDVTKIERTRLPLEDTEMNPSAADLPVSVRMEILRANPEARTYQFVARLDPAPLPRPHEVDPAGEAVERSEPLEPGLVEELVRAAGEAKTALAIGPGAAAAAARLVDSLGSRVVYLDAAVQEVDAASAWGADRAAPASLDDAGWADLVAGESFEVIILGDLFERVTDPWNLLRVIRDRALLAPGGGIAACVVNSASYRAIASFFDVTASSSYGIVGADRLRFFTRRSLSEVCERAGFVVQQLRHVPPASGPPPSLPPAVRRFLEETSDASATHLVIRAEPAAEPAELARLLDTIERLGSEHGRLLNEIAAERKTFNDQRSASSEAYQALRAKLERFRIAAEAQRDLAIERRKEISAIRRSGSWRLARRIAAIAHGLRDPVWALRQLRARSRSGSRGRRPYQDSVPDMPSTSGPTRSPSPARTERSPVPSVLPSGLMAEPEEPRLSIVIPVYNGNEVTRQCLESIFSAATEVSFEVIVVDNASSDGVTTWLAEQLDRWPNMKLISNDTNRGFGPGVNQGAEAARGEYVLICNSDVIIPGGSLDRLVRTLDEHPDIGVVSPVTNYVGEGPQLDPEAADVTAETVDRHAAHVAARAAPLTFVPDRLVFFCVLVPKGLFGYLGGFPEAYGVGNFEDDDFCVRARMAGYRLAIDPNIFVFHHGSASWKDGAVSHAEWMQRNRPIYFERLARLSTTLIPRPRAVVRDPETTVIVRTVDRPELLRQALVSLANQTYDDFEVVVVNDAGSRIDGLLAEFDPYLTIRYVHHANAQGRASALNDGIAAARGRWITYLDDDDIVYPMHLDVLVHAVRESGFRVAYCDVDKVLCSVGKERSTVVTRKQFASFEFEPKALLVSNRLPIQSIIHAAACVPAVGGFDPSLDVLEDWDFVIRLSQRFPFYHVRRVTSEYRFRVSSEAENTIVSRRAEVLETQRAIYERYPVSDERLEEHRRRQIDDLRAQIADIRVIRESTLPESAKALEIARLVLAFRPSAAELTRQERQVPTESS